MWRSALVGGSIADSATWHPENLDWTLVQSIVLQNRLWTAVDTGLRLNDIVPPAEFVRSTDAARSMTQRMNSLALTTIRKIMPHFGERRIRAVVMKGPLHQHDLHASYFARLSTDIDVLVPQTQFEAALDMLRSVGYMPSQTRTSMWWRVFLGEEHLRAQESSLGMIDLHHRVQQPGCPAPRFLNDFTDQPEQRSLGTAQIPVLSQPNARLLTCISIVKGFLHREPVGTHLNEFAAAALQSTEAANEEFIQMARYQRMENTVLFALRSTELVTGLHLATGSMRKTTGLRVLDHDLIVDMLLRPSRVESAWPRRSQLLWSLSDDDRYDKRLARYVKEWAWSTSSDICRRIVS